MASNPQPPLMISTLIILLSFSIFTIITTSSQTIHKGFSTSPKPPPSSSSSPPFQPILTDPTSTFAFGFLPYNLSFVDLAVVHIPSSFPLWRATPSQPIPWSTSTSLSFDGSLLLLSHPDTGTLWSTPKVNNADDGLLLLLFGSSNLQIRKSQLPDSVLYWQSFDSPFDSIVQDQNLTSKSALVSANRQFSMRLGPTYLALHMEQPGRPMYWKHTAIQAKAQIVDGDGPIYARVDSTGFLGLYQNEKAPADVISFDTFNGGVRLSLRRLTLESDGNLKAYYWSNGSGWVSDFVAIPKLCDLPAACGPYGVCYVDGQVCGGCVDNRKAGSGCFEAGSGDFCGGSGDNGFRVYRRAGVDLANKELIGFDKVVSLEDCEELCESNCSCWGAVFSNISGYCYRVEYPVQTVLAVGDEGKVGYFKVRNVGGGGGEERRKRAEVMLVVAGALVLAGSCGFAGYRVWKGRRRNGEDEMGMMPYKDLKSSSFRSIEMSSNSFRK